MARKQNESVHVPVSQFLQQSNLTNHPHSPSRDQTSVRNDDFKNTYLTMDAKFIRNLESMENFTPLGPADISHEYEIVGASRE